MAGILMALRGMKQKRFAVAVAIVWSWGCCAAAQSTGGAAGGDQHPPQVEAQRIAPPMSAPMRPVGPQRSGAVPATQSPPQVAPPQMHTATQNTASATSADTVVDVRVVGNQNVPLTKIAPYVRTRAGRPFDQDLLEGDVRRLSQTKMFVKLNTFTRRVDGGVVVVFEVLERPLLHYVKYIGATAFSVKQIKKQTELNTGDPLDPFAVTESRRKLEEYYKEKGYPKARVTVVEGDKPGDQGAVFLVNEGVKQRVLWTSFVGNTISSGARLRTLIESKPGFLWLFKGEVDRKKIDDDKNKLIDYYHSLGFFQVRVGHTLDFTESQAWLSLTFVIDEGPRSVINEIHLVGNNKFTVPELTEKMRLTAAKPFVKTEMDMDVQGLRDRYGSIGYVFADVRPEIRYLEQPGHVDLFYTIDEGARYRVGRINIRIEGEYPRTALTTILNRLSVRPGDVIDTRELRESERRLNASGLFQVAPHEGVKPKIVYSPPEMDKTDGPTSTAERPASGGNSRRGPRYRGQSPAPGSAEAGSGDQVLDLTVSGRSAFVPGAPGMESEAASPVFLAPAQLPPPAAVQPEQYLAPQPVYPQQQCAPPAPNAQPQAEPIPQAQPGALPPPEMIIRGQYTSGAGYSTPQPTQPGTRPGYYPAQAAGAASAPQPAYAAQPQMSASYAPVPNTAAAPPPAANYVAPATNYYTPPAVSAAPAAGGPPEASGSGSLFAPESVFNDPSFGELTRPLPLDVVARETETGKLMFGVGINSDAGVFGQVVIDERNFAWNRLPRDFEDIRNGRAFRGDGQQFRMELVPGSQFQRYMVNFREPYFLNTDWSLMLSGYYYNRLYNEWTEERLGGKPGLGYQLTHELSTMFSVRAERIKVTNPIGGDIPGITPDALREVVDNGAAAAYGFEWRLAHDTRDSAFLATQGHLYELSFEQVIGTYRYAHAEIDLRKYFTLHQRADGSGRHVLSVVTKFGVADSLTPIYDHYYAGGFSTVRGFYFRSVSPRENTVAVGGTAMLLASAEYMFPITADDMLRGVVFCDTGTVQPTFDAWKGGFRVAPGFGLRISVPALGPAPIALDLAFPLVSEEGDRINNFSFFIGLNR